METIAEAVERLTAAGYTDDFRAEPDGLRAVRAGRRFAPEELCIDEIVRFEGESDPEDEAVVFALRSSDGAVRGTFVTAYGPVMDPLNAEMARRLHRVDRAQRGSAGGARSA